MPVADKTLLQTRVATSVARKLDTLAKTMGHKRAGSPALPGRATRRDENAKSSHKREHQTTPDLSEIQLENTQRFQDHARDDHPSSRKQ